MHKNHLLFLGISLFVASCQQKPIAQEEAETPVQETSTQALKNEPVNVLAQYEQFLLQLDSADVRNVSKAATKYITLFKGQPLPLADSGYVFFDRFYLRVDKTINEIHAKDTTDFYPLVLESSKSVPKKLKEYEKSVQENGFQLAMTEGMTYLQQDRDFHVTNFYPYISPVLKLYLTQLNKEIKEGFDEDGGLTITPTQFADRIIWWENFLQKHPNFIFSKEGRANLESYRTIILVGMDHTPVLGYENNKLDPYYSEAYRYLLRMAPNSKSANIIQPYFQALQKFDTASANSLIKQYQKAGIIYNPYSE